MTSNNDIAILHNGNESMEMKKMNQLWTVINTIYMYVCIYMHTYIYIYVMGPCYACLFVGYVEEKMPLTYPGTKPIMLRRYTDDYIGTSVRQLRKELEDFIQYVNDFHPSLSYTFYISDTSVNFLDISISMTQHGATT